MSWIYLNKNAIGKHFNLPEVEDILEGKSPFWTCKKQEENWGLATLRNDHLVWIIPPIYSDAGHFSEGLWPCKKDNTWGFLDSLGQEVLPFQWDYVYSFYYGLAIASKDNKWGMINKQGQWVIPPKADYLRSYSNDVCIGRIRGTWFVLDLNAKTTLTPKVNFMNSFYNGLSAFNVGGTILQDKLVMGGNWGFINKMGQNIIPATYSWVGNFITHYAPFYKREEDQWGLISTNGQELILEGFSGIREFSQDLATVEKDGLWGFADLKGKEIISCQYREVKPFVNNIAFAKIEPN